LENSKRPFNILLLQFMSPFMALRVISRAFHLWEYENDPKPKYGGAALQRQLSFPESSTREAND
jgi:hypothetical protein